MIIIMSFGYGAMLYTEHSIILCSLLSSLSDPRLTEKFIWAPGDFIRNRRNTAGCVPAPLDQAFPILKAFGIT